MAYPQQFTEGQKKIFLEKLEECGSVRQACRSVTITRHAVYKAADNDEDFAARWREAKENVTDKLEEEAFRRAYGGVDKPVTYQGEVTDTYKEYSDRMLELLLKSNRPEKYKDRQEVSGTGGGPLTIELVRFGSGESSE